ncbi:S1 RNA-binding domain-containing protein [Serpentinicella alkaliphila]|uniref:S1 motif domain-containing protein n=1 Tax=Serpentinicella alkaliphila TaxID=1734049 RepID=A0A4R2TCV2_9FIRM|nr:S1-like domain-containing RNA-binding protein [Serpentinicella alkaliphila]QUH25767.1 S1 RNA-binding domain-containing protein [Serpentinicella alkaliphila]TCP99766.1 hypothetical protein EDD79_10339 [Serpentinicella alkaliphila]
MIEIGKIQKLEILRMTSVGAFLNSKEDSDGDDILLPNNQIDSDLEVGDEVEVFVYRDSEDRLIATVNKPKLTLGQLAYLKVVDVTKIGAFMDWGLEKDLLLPFNEQTVRVRVGKEYLVALYLDKSQRLCATMDIYKYLQEDAPYKEDARVRGIVYKVNEDVGVFVAVDNTYYGLIPKSEVFRDYKVGERIEARVVRAREDGKLDLSMREKAYLQMDEDSKLILEKLENNNGILYLNDKSDANAIKLELNMSKNAFKRAVGRLLKEGKIKFIDNGIELLD